MSEALSFTINGQRFNLTSDDVERRLANVEPDVLRDHGAKVNGRIYPVKQVVAVATGLDRLDFQSMQARSVLRRLGFELWRSA